MNLRPLACCAALFLAALPTAVVAAPVTYNDPLAFAAMTPDASFEGFETLFTPAAIASLPAFTVTEISVDPEIRPTLASTMVSDGVCALEYRSDGPSSVRFIFSEPQTAFSVWITSFGNTGPGTFSVTDNSGASSSQVLATSPGLLPPLNRFFYGIYSADDPFTEVVFSSTTVNDVISFDGVSYMAATAVPEPSAVAMLAAAAGMAIAYRVRRSRLSRRAN